jgi:lysyl-tRNA synthetase class 2
VSERERAARRERLEALRKSGIDPYPARVGPREAIADVRARFEHRDAETLEADPEGVAVAGRITAIRSFGKLLFLNLVENGAKIQVSVKKNEIAPELFQRIKSFDVADFVRVEGSVWRPCGARGPTSSPWTPWTRSSSRRPCARCRRSGTD